MTMTHLSDDDLRRWRDGAAESERGRMVSHLAECESCAGRYASIFRNRPLETPVTPAPEELTQRGYAAYGRPRVNSWTSLFAKPAVALASLAVIVAVVWTIRDRQAEPVYRGAGAGVELLTPPDGSTVANDVAFQWRAEDATGCRLRVYDPSHPDSPVVDRRADSGAQAQAGERERLVSGVTYRWFVECASADGQRSVSTSRRFDIR
jgi:hypothetical protein